MGNKYIEVATQCVNTGMAFLYDLQTNYSSFHVELIAVIFLAVVLL
jgi:hypothetical protein